MYTFSALEVAYTDHTKLLKDAKDVIWIHAETHRKELLESLNIRRYEEYDKCIIQFMIAKCKGKHLAFDLHKCIKHNENLLAPNAKCKGNPLMQLRHKRTIKKYARYFLKTIKYIAFMAESKYAPGTIFGQYRSSFKELKSLRLLLYWRIYRGRKVC